MPAPATLLAAELLEGGRWHVHLVLADGQQGHLLLDGDGYRTTTLQELADLLTARLAARPVVGGAGEPDIHS
jgi:hypothetical protein